MHQARYKIHAITYHSARLRNHNPTRTNGIAGRISLHFHVAVLHKSSSQKNMGIKWKKRRKPWCQGEMRRGSSEKAVKKIPQYTTEKTMLSASKTLSLFRWICFIGAPLSFEGPQIVRYANNDFTAFGSHRRGIWGLPPWQCPVFKYSGGSVSLRRLLFSDGLFFTMQTPTRGRFFGCLLL